MANEIKITQNHHSISDDINSKLSKDLSATDNKTPANTSAKQSSAVPTDTVSLTPAAQFIKSFEENMSTLSSVDDIKIEQMRELIQSGKYDFNASRVAEKFLEFEFNLLK